MPSQDSSTGPPLGQKAIAERRSEPRVPIRGELRSDHGRVVDLSLSGVRILSETRWEEECVHRVCIESDSRTLVIDARCRWCRQAGLREHLVGLAFEEPTEEQLAIIGELLSGISTPLG